jgi:very-short-patch-repair endonuclease
LFEIVRILPLSAFGISPLPKGRERDKIKIQAIKNFFIMTQIYNKISEKGKRKQLRNNMTMAENILWGKLKGKQIETCKFRRQYSVNEFVIDFYCPELKLAIEIDGESHFQDNAVEYDKERQVLIESIGIEFLRFNNNEVYTNLNGVLEVIAEKVRFLRSTLAPLPLA